MSIRKVLGRVGIVLSAAVTVVVWAGCSPGVTVVIDGAPYSYDSVKIGNLTWTKQNINIETRNNSFCYKYDKANCTKYGRLYTWDAAKSVCASMGGGWRLPDSADWNNLMRAVGGEVEYDTYGRTMYKNAAKKLRATNGWDDYNGASGNGTDDYGFSALPEGNFNPSGGGTPFKNRGSLSYFWSATEYENGKRAYIWVVSPVDLVKEIGHNTGFDFLTARCVRNN